MGRPAKFDADGILDATATLVADGGPARATIANIADHLGAPSGSIYHRFATRDRVLAGLWVRTVRRAQEGFVAALADPDVDLAATNAMLHVPRWSRAHLAEAKVLVLHRRQDLAEQWPVELGDELEHLNDGMRAALTAFVRRRLGQVTRTTMARGRFALIDIPYAAVRGSLLEGRRPPPLVDDLIVTAGHAVLAGHRSSPAVER